MSTNAAFIDRLKVFLKDTDPTGLSAEDIKYQTSLAVIVLTDRASKRPGGYTILDLASQGTRGGGPPHFPQALAGFGISL
jgi:hypothetical protein